MRTLFLCPLVVLLAACSDAQRVAYESLENTGQQQCLRQHGPAECGNKTEYERYQRERKTLEERGD